MDLWFEQVPPAVIGRWWRKTENTSKIACVPLRLLGFERERSARCY